MNLRWILQLYNAYIGFTRDGCAFEVPNHTYRTIYIMLKRMLAMHNIRNGRHYDTDCIVPGGRYENDVRTECMPKSDSRTNSTFGE